MTRHVEHIAIRIVLKALGTEGHTLIQRHVGTDDTGLTDDDARAVVDGKIFTYLRPWMDVDTRLGVSLLSDDTRQDGNLHTVQDVGNTVVGHSIHHGVTEDDLTIGLRGRVVVEHRLNIGIQQPFDLWQFVNKTQSQPPGRLFSIAAALRAELQAAGNLPL